MQPPRSEEGNPLMGTGRPKDVETARRAGMRARGGAASRESSVKAGRQHPTTKG